MKHKPVNLPHGVAREAVLDCHTCGKKFVLAFRQNFQLAMPHHVDAGDAQIAPGQYEITLPAPRAPMLAVLRHDQTVLDRRSVPGRYAREFERIGNNHAAMHQLAARTAGAVLDPQRASPIDFHWPAQPMSLTPWLVTASCLLLACGLILVPLEIRRELRARTPCPTLAPPAKEMT